MTRFPVALLVAFCALLWAGDARAALVTWHLSGTIDSVGSGDAAALGSLGVHAGTPFAADIVYDSSAPLQLGGSYTPTLLSLSFNAAAYSLRASPMTGYDSNGIFAPVGGQYFRIFWSPEVLPSVTDPRVTLELTSPDPANGDALPIAPPVGPGTQLSLLFSTLSSNPAIASHSFTISYSVPEPRPGQLVLSLAATLVLAYSLASRGSQRHSDCGTSRIRWWKRQRWPSRSRHS